MTMDAEWGFDTTACTSRDGWYVALVVAVLVMASVLITMMCVLIHIWANRHDCDCGVQPIIDGCPMIVMTENVIVPGTPESD